MRHYKDEIDRIQKQKSRLIKSSNKAYSELEFRYSFKLGFYSELRKDRDSALNHYKKCYNESINAYMPNSNSQELKVFSDKLLHRIQCNLLLYSTNGAKVQESIKLFRNHLIRFRSMNKGVKIQK